MRNRLRASVIVVATGTVIVLLSLFVRPTEGQAPAGYRAARLPGTTQPNLSGIWQAVNTANYDIQTHPARPALVVVPGPAGYEVPAAPVLALGAAGGVPGGIGVVEGDEIPYQPWAAARKKENFENMLTRDPEIKCFSPGLPRATYMPYPFQIIQGTSNILMVYEFADANRTIHMDKVAKPPEDRWMGFSLGHWEGDTLVVDVTNNVENTWFDRAGNFHSDALHLIERFTPMSADHLLYEVTIEDPKVFTRPWKMRMPLYRRVEQNAELVEYKCVQFVEELMYGHLRKEQLVRHWEGDTFDVDITRKIPKGGVYGLSAPK
jgi:hypothetical protein